MALLPLAGHVLLKAARFCESKLEEESDIEEGYIDISFIQSIKSYPRNLGNYFSGKIWL